MSKSIHYTNMPLSLVYVLTDGILTSQSEVLGSVARRLIARQMAKMVLQVDHFVSIMT